MSLDYTTQIHGRESLSIPNSFSSVRDSDKSKPYIPCAGVSSDGWSKDNEATATCFCGAVQLAFVSLSSYRKSHVVLVVFDHNFLMPSTTFL